MNTLTLLEGKTFNPNKPVHVYRNLNKKGVVYSVRQNGIVIAYTSDLCLEGAKYVINHKQADKVRANKVRMVHAWIEGTVIAAPPVLLAATVSYNPYKFTHFYNKANNEPVMSSKYAHFTTDGVLF